MNEEEIKELRTKILKGLDMAFMRLIAEKKMKNEQFVFSLNGKIVKMSAEEVEKIVGILAEAGDTPAATPFQQPSNSATACGSVKSSITALTLSRKEAAGLVVDKPITRMPAAVPARIPEKESSKTTHSSGAECKSPAAS